jgi:hypothetical protein
MLIFRALALAAPVFEVLPPDRVAFNYPPPPQEGAAGFFSIAKDGKAECIIVQARAASSSEQAAIRTFQTYLNLSTGARFTVASEDKGR